MRMSPAATLTPLLILVLLALCLGVAAPVHAQEIPVSPAFVGDLPAEGGAALVMLGRAQRPEALVDALALEGCAAASLGVTREGQFLPYVAGAPSFVNADFPRLLAAASIVAVRCARPVIEVPDAGLLHVVSKERALPPGFEPAEVVPLAAERIVPGLGAQYLVPEAASALEAMLAAASAAGVDLRVRSAYRSYAEQVTTHQHWVAVYGPEEAARRSAVPGHSEHQLGTTVDLTAASVGWELDFTLDDTPEGDWLRRNAPRHGFVLSYPDGAEETTGYRYEPWHYRYVGVTHAEWLRFSGLTLIEYLRKVEDAAGPPAAAP